MAFVNEERKKYTIYPPAKDVFSWTLSCPIRQVYVHVYVYIASSMCYCRRGFGLIYMAVLSL